MANSVIQKSLASDVNNLESEAVLLVDTAYPNTDEVVSYPCNWTEYRYLIITTGTYNNVMTCALVPKSYFSNTTSGGRLQLFAFSGATSVIQFYVNIYKNGNTAIYIQFSVASTSARARIWGIK